MSAETDTDDAALAVGFWIARREERKPTNWIATIRLFDGREIATTVKDISQSGARLVVPESVALPDRFMFRVIGRDFVCAVRVAWRKKASVGVQIERMAKLEPRAPTQPEPKAPPEAAVTEQGPRQDSRVSRFGAKA